MNADSCECLGVHFSHRCICSSLDLVANDLFAKIISGIRDEVMVRAIVNKLDFPLPPTFARCDVQESHMQKFPLHSKFVLQYATSNFS